MASGSKYYKGSERDIESIKGKEEEMTKLKIEVIGIFEEEDIRECFVLYFEHNIEVLSKEKEKYKYWLYNEVKNSNMIYFLLLF